MRRRTELEVAIVKKGLKKGEVAKRAKVNPSYFSLAISGRFNLSDDEKRRVAKVLNRPVQDLFPVEV